MQKILAALTAALAFVFGNKTNIAALKQQIADRDTVIAEQNTRIEDLLKVVEDDKTDDAALEAAAATAREGQAAAETRTAELEAAHTALTAEITTAEEKAAELAASISADSSIPITVDPGTGAVTPQ